MAVRSRILFGECCNGALEAGKSSTLRSSWQASPQPKVPLEFVLTFGWLHSWFTTGFTAWAPVTNGVLGARARGQRRRHNVRGSVGQARCPQHFVEEVSLLSWGPCQPRGPAPGLASCHLVAHCGSRSAISIFLCMSSFVHNPFYA